MIKKIVLIGMFLLLVTGCTVEYNMDINKDLIIDESIKVKERSSIVDTQTMNVDLFLDKTIEDYQDDPRYPMYIYEKYTDDKETYVIAKSYYLDFENYKNTSNIIEILFDDLQVIKEDNTYNLIYKSKNVRDIEIFKESELYNNLIDEVRVNITLPFKVISNNSNLFDIDKSTYVWIFKKDKPLSDINIKFDISKSAVKKEKYGIYLVGGLFVGILLLMSFTYYKYRNFNKT